MKLQDYFHQQSNKTLSDQEKISLYQNIIQKREKATTQRKTLFRFTKTLTYTTLAVFLVIAIFGTFLMEDAIFTNENDFFSLKSPKNNSVNAGYIGKIIEVDGEFSIEKNGKQYQTTDIADGDILQLKEGTKIKFNIDETTKAEIIGPATLSISREGEGKYKIILKQGNFFQINSPKETGTIEIETENMTITQPENQPLNIQLIKEGNQTYIKNNGPEVKISKTDNNQQKIEKTIKDQEILSIQDNDISLITDTKTFDRLLAEKDITKTVAVNLPKKEDHTKSVKDKPEISENIETDIQDFLGQEFTANEEIDPSVTDQLTTIVGKSVPTEEQSSALKTNLDTFFIQNTLEDIFKNYLEGNTDQFNQKVKNLSTKVNNLSKIFNSELSAKANLESIQQTILSLHGELSEKYHIPPKYLTQIQIIANWMQYISEKNQSGSFTQDEAQQKWDELKQNLPSSLKLQ